MNSVCILSTVYNFIESCLWWYHTSIFFHSKHYPVWMIIMSCHTVLRKMKKRSNLCIRQMLAFQLPSARVLIFFSQNNLESYDVSKRISVGRTLLIAISGPQQSKFCLLSVSLSHCGWPQLLSRATRKMEVCSGTETAKQKGPEPVCPAKHTRELLAFFICLKNVKLFLELDTKPVRRRF